MAKGPSPRLYRQVRAQDTSRYTAAADRVYGSADADQEYSGGVPRVVYGAMYQGRLALRMGTRVGYSPHQEQEGGVIVSL